MTMTNVSICYQNRFGPKQSRDQVPSYPGSICSPTLWYGCNLLARSDHDFNAGR